MTKIRRPFGVHFGKLLSSTPCHRRNIDQLPSSTHCHVGVSQVLNQKTHYIGTMFATNGANMASNGRRTATRTGHPLLPRTTRLTGRRHRRGRGQQVGARSTGRSDRATGRRPTGGGRAGCKSDATLHCIRLIARVGCLF